MQQIIIYLWFYESSDSSHDSTYTSWDMATVSKMGPTIAVGLPKLRVWRQYLSRQVRAVQSNQSAGWSNTKGGEQLAHPVPHREDLASSSFGSEFWLGGFLHAPLSRPVLRPNRMLIVCVLRNQAGIKFTHIPFRKWIQNNQCHNIQYLLPKMSYKRLSRTLSEALQRKDTITPQEIDLWQSLAYNS
jgi:hypothetical protein